VRWLLVPLTLAACTATGCAGWWDEVTSKDYKLKSAFHRSDPMTVLEKDPDGDHRARAIQALREPIANGGSQQEQDLVVTLLVRIATADQQDLCRAAAIRTLGSFRDSRAVEGLKDAYYRASSFGPEKGALLRCHALTALGETKQDGAVELLVKVLREPPVEGSEIDKQQKTDERIVAARALANFPNYQATEALIGVLRMDQDVALRDRAHESLVTITGRELPAEAQVWDEFLHSPGNKDSLVGKPSLFDKFVRLVGSWDK
jgi:hypothetical protein